MNSFLSSSSALTLRQGQASFPSSFFRWYEWRDYPQQRMERLDPKLLCGRVEVSIVLCIFQVPSERSWPATLISSKSTAYSMDSNTRSCALPRSAVPTFASRPPDDWTGGRQDDKVISPVRNDRRNVISITALLSRRLSDSIALRSESTGLVMKPSFRSCTPQTADFPETVSSATASL